MDNRAAPPDGSIALQILFFLRFIQLGSTVLTGFIACYFVWWHDRLHDKIPQGLIIVICTCSLAFFESYISSAYALSKRARYPNYELLLNTTIPSALAMSWGYWSLRQVPFVREWCEGDNWFRPVVMYNSDAGVEEHHCALTCDIIITGAIALSFTVFIALFAILGVVRESRMGCIKLEGRTPDFSDDLLLGHGDIEKEVDI